MGSKYEHAELLTALWKLGAESETRLPTSHGILDRALEACRDKLPESLSSALTFGVTGVGLRCFELPSILLAAQEAMLTSEPNPTYLSTIVTVDEDSARQIALTNGLSTNKAKEIGRALYDEVQRIACAQQASPGHQRTAA